MNRGQIRKSKLSLLEMEEIFVTMGDDLNFIRTEVTHKVWEYLEQEEKKLDDKLPSLKQEKGQSRSDC